jgi:hypothetical protein
VRASNLSGCFMIDKIFGGVRVYPFCILRNGWIGAFCKELGVLAPRVIG